MIKKLMDPYFGLNVNQYDLMKYLISNLDKDVLIDSMRCLTSKFNELIQYISYMSDFEIEVLTPKQIEEYKGKQQANSVDSLKKMQVLKKMLENNLITAIEYDKKKTEF